MAKLSKRKRRLVAEKALRRAEEEKHAGIPYSNPTVFVCHHFEGSGGGIIIGTAYPTLFVSSSSKDKCVCSQCGREFPIEFRHEMDELTRAYRNSGCCEVSGACERLRAKSRPVTYYYSAPNERCYL